MNPYCHKTNYVIMNIPKSNINWTSFQFHISVLQIVVIIGFLVIILTGRFDYS